MCLAVHKNSRIITAIKDITVYKVVYGIGNDYESLYARFKYRKNEKYSICKNLLKEADNGMCFDMTELKIVDSSKIIKKNRRWVHQGFHFAFKESRLRTPLKNDSNRIIVKCTIPKGAKYIKGIDKDLGVSDTIILH